MEHQLVEASKDLKQSLATNSELSTQQDAAEARQHLAEEKAEALRPTTEIVELKQMVEERDEKLSSSASEMVDLRAAKDEAEAELDQNYEDSKELLKQ